MDQSLHFYKFYITDAPEDEDIMRAVRAITSLLKLSRFDDGSGKFSKEHQKQGYRDVAEVTACGPTFTQYYGLVDMEDQAMAAFHMLVVAQFLSSCFVLGFRLAAAYMLSNIMLYMEIWGIVMSLVKLNVFSLIAIAMVTSLSPLFSSDLVVAFKENPDLPPEQRLGKALRGALPAMYRGSLCMLGALLPLLASPFPLIVQYFALPSIIAVLLGVLHGSVTSPALLALVAQNEVMPMRSLEDSECVGVAVEVPALQVGPNLLQSAAPGQFDKSK